MSGLGVHDVKFIDSIKVLKKYQKELKNGLIIQLRKLEKHFRSDHIQDNLL